MSAKVLSLVTASCLVLAACASDGVGTTQSPPPTPTPTPTPTPAPTPTPTPTPPANPTLTQALSSNQDFASDSGNIKINLVAVGGVTQIASAAATSLTVHYDAASASYSLTSTGGDATFTSADLSPTSPAGQAVYNNASGDQLTLITASPSTHRALSYVALGVWKIGQPSGGAPIDAFDTFTYGMPTAASATPRTGAGGYAVDMMGYYTTLATPPASFSGGGVFNVDFRSGLFETDITASTVDLASGKPTCCGVELVAQGHLSAADGSFSGTASLEEGVSADNGADFVGPITGRFYGPVGQEVGATFSGGLPSGGGAVGSLIGALNGAPPVENLTLTNIYIPQAFPALGAGFLLFGSPGSYSASANFTPTGQMTLAPGGNVGFAPGSPNLQAENYASTNEVAPSLPNFTTYQQNANGVPLELDLYNVGPGNTELALSYMDLAIWRQDGRLPGSTTPTGPQSNVLYTVFGMTTPAGVLSRLTGTAQYTGVAYGFGVTSSNSRTSLDGYNLTGVSTFNVDFTAQSISGGFNLQGAEVNGGPGQTFGAFTWAGPIGLADTALGRNGNSIPIYQSGNYVGRIFVQFFGPGAEEAGGTFNINVSPGGPSGGIASLSGAVAAKR